MSDVRMSGLTGPQLLDAIAADGRLAGVPVILLSAYFPRFDPCHDLIARGATACLTKTESPNQVLAVTRGYMPLQ